MQLTVKDVADLLKVNEKTIYRWLKKGALPAYKVGEQYRFNRGELLEWATSRQMHVSPDLFQEPDQLPANYGLGNALRAGGIYYRTEGEHKEAALHNVVNLMKLPPEVNREYLYQVILAREAMASTAIGDGIAIPHVRNPIVLHIIEPVISLCFLEKAIDFHALDGKPVNCLFTLVSPTVKSHLHLLSRLAYALQDSEFRRVITEQSGRDEIYSVIRRIESDLPQPPGNATKE